MMTQSTRGDGYWPAVALVLLAMCPGLINSTATSMLSPSIAASLGTSPTDVSWVELLGNAGYPLGSLLCADLTQRFVNRSVFLASLTIFAVSSFACAAAPTLTVLIIARIVQGFATGLLDIVAIPPLITGFSVKRLPISTWILIMGLFGSATLGPIVGGVVEQTETWRLLFAVNGVLGLVALPLCLAVVVPKPGRNPHLRLDVPALVLAFIGIAALFYGIGNLSYHNWDDVSVYLPVAIGVVALVALIVVEALQREPLMPVRYLARPLPLAGALISWAGAVAFFGLFSILPEYLLQVRGLGAMDTGFHLWATVLGAVVGAAVCGVLFVTKWLPPLAIGALLLMAVAAWMLAGLTAFTDYGTISWIAFLLGFGGGVSVAPGMLLAGLSLPAPLLGRTIALVSLIRIALQYAVGPALTHAIGTQASIHYSNLAAQVDTASSSFQALVSQLTQQFTQAGMALSQAHTAAMQTIIELLMRHGQVLGINDIAAQVLVMTVLGAAIAGAILLVLALRNNLPTLAESFETMMAEGVDL
jgi:EmrB/QacA subfamily drug resistance transporter